MAVFLTEGNFIVRVYKDKGARNFIASSPKDYYEAKKFAQHLVDAGDAYKVVIHNQSFVTITNDPDFLKGSK